MPPIWMNDRHSMNLSIKPNKQRKVLIMKKNALKMTVISLLAMGLLLLSAGCQLRPQARPATPEVSSPAPSIPELPNNSETSEEGDATLFNSIFVPMAQGKLGANLAALREAAAQYGYKYISEAGVVVLLDSAQPDCSVRAEPAGSDPSAKINRLVYLRHIGDHTRQAAITNLDEETPLFYIQPHFLQEGTQVFSLEEVEAFLTSEEAEPIQVEYGLLDNLFLPVIQGTLGRDAAAFKGRIEQCGYVYKDADEGMFYVYDPANPYHYLYGYSPLIQDTDTVGEMGIHLDMGGTSRDAEVNLCKNPPEYYIDTGSWETRTQVSSPEEIKNYFFQK